MRQDDDPLAIGLANIFQIWREAEILGIVSSVSAQYAPSAIDAISELAATTSCSKAPL
jgi:hypothetical protein